MRPRVLVLGLAFAAGSAALAAAADRLDAQIGERLFRRAWVPGVSSTTAADGLGPRYNARSCLACHQGLARVDARASDALDRGLAVKLGDREGAPDPRYGRQLQTIAVPGVAPEPAPEVRWRPRPGPDGRRLEAPVLSVEGAAVPAGLRAAPALAAMGAVEAVPEAAILARADPDDRDGDGIRGRPHRLPDGRVGRFGWKATSADLHDQVSRAFSVDMGLSTRAFPAAAGDCTASDASCLAAPSGASVRGVEMDEAIVTRIAAYLTSLAPAVAQRGGGGAPKADSAGARLFAATGCAACHVADPGGTGRPIHSDLLLHDLGPGLDDGVAEGDARSSEWRTAPLVGLGRAERAGLLHDGRARSIEEAAMWHDGEARRARAAFAALPSGERARLVAYLRQL